MGLPKGFTVLFQGDSITDAGRPRDVTEPNKGLGHGYALMAAARLLASQPADELKCLNYGISGNRVVDLYARWKEHALILKPDLISILIGINDTWHEFSRGTGVAIEKYETIYRMLLRETKDALPGVKFVLCEPFYLLCGAVTEAWAPDVQARQAVVRALAEEFDAILVPFQQLFDDAAQDAPIAYWAADGVHPSFAAHQRMADFWLKHVLAAF
jgi:lysophospholipase L1-like esterase